VISSSRAIDEYWKYYILTLDFIYVDLHLSMNKGRVSHHAGSSVLMRYRDSLKMLEKMDKIKKNMGIAKLLSGESNRTEPKGRIEHRMKANCILFLESPTLFV